MKKNIGLAALLAVLVIGLGVGTFYDLAINQAVYSPQNYFAIFMEAVGFWPLYLPIALLFGVWAKCDKLYKKIIGNVLCAATLISLGGVGVKYTIKRNVSAIMVIIPLIICAGLLLWILYKPSLSSLKKLWFLGVAGSAYMLLNNIVINIAKALWQRPRFDEMLAQGSLDAFQPWHNILGSGGSSFPSGHTGAACGIFLLLALCSLYKFWNKKYALMMSICWSYVGLMAIGRIMIGRHFLSDTVAAAFIGFAVFAAMRQTKAYKKGLAAALSEG